LISIFALIVITTATVEKFILEKKYEYLKGESSAMFYYNETKLKEMKYFLKMGKDLEEENKKLKEKLKKERKSPIFLN